MFGFLLNNRVIGKLFQSVLESSGRQVRKLRVFSVLGVLDRLPDLRVCKSSQGSAGCSIRVLEVYVLRC